MPCLPLKPCNVGLFTPREALCAAEVPNSKVADSDSTQHTIDLMSLTASGRNHSKITPVQKCMPTAFHSAKLKA